jgi:hypothetical protein
LNKNGSPTAFIAVSLNIFKQNEAAMLKVTHEKYFDMINFGKNILSNILDQDLEQRFLTKGPQRGF